MPLVNLSVTAPPSNVAGVKGFGAETFNAEANSANSVSVVAETGSCSVNAGTVYSRQLLPT